MIKFAKFLFGVFNGRYAQKRKGLDDFWGIRHIGKLCSNGLYTVYLTLKIVFAETDFSKSLIGGTLKAFYGRTTSSYLNEV
jgi:hypothetical protein